MYTSCKTIHSSYFGIGEAGKDFRSTAIQQLRVFKQFYVEILSQGLRSSVECFKLK